MIMACKRFYQRKYLHEVLVVLEEEEDLIKDTRGLRMLNNIRGYNLKSGLYNFASAWKDVKITTLANCWKKLLLDQYPELNFEGFTPDDFHQIFLRTGETDITVEDVENWFDDNDADPGYQILSLGETAYLVVNPFAPTPVQPLKSLPCPCRCSNSENNKQKFFF